ncbi:MAG: glycosyl transferase [Flavobacteriaceae bacterium]|nr:glycosyl transferase [Flavobacteriaceae bacterium]
MRFVLISHVLHSRQGDRWFAYGPYVREMNLWGKHVSFVEVVAPVVKAAPTAIQTAYSASEITLTKVSAFSFISVSEALRALYRIPVNFVKIIHAMRRADHIHLRCPGNMGLLGCMVQVFFPKTPKSAKYAGNWDPKARQPLSYRLQKWILGNTFLTRNMKVLVYGDWPRQSKNIVPFFTASYSEIKKQDSPKKLFNPPWQFLFVGSLTPGKRPLYAIQLVDKLQHRGIAVRLDIYGEGPERSTLETFIKNRELGDIVRLHGNQNSESIEEAYRNSHFLMLPSKSEGWPKVIAEMMFYAGIAIATPVSCVPWMLDQGARGILLRAPLDQDAEKISTLLERPEQLNSMSESAAAWSRQYTLEAFEKAIKEILK